MLPRMRTIPKAIDEIHVLDPDSAFTIFALRRLIKRGDVPVVKTGNKQLVNLDALLEYLSHPEACAAEEDASPSGIHPIKI